MIFNTSVHKCKGISITFGETLYLGAELGGGGLNFKNLIVLSSLDEQGLWKTVSTDMTPY